MTYEHFCLKLNIFIVYIINNYGQLTFNLAVWIYFFLSILGYPPFLSDDPISACRKVPYLIVLIAFDKNNNNLLDFFGQII